VLLAGRRAAFQQTALSQAPGVLVTTAQAGVGVGMMPRSRASDPIKLVHQSDRHGQS
jgi:hypothetical protein